MQSTHKRSSKDTLLTIDLDYWKEVKPSTVTFLNRIVSLRVPKILTKHHHQVLPFVNRYKTKVLINVDYHSDLCEDDADGTLPDLDCGSWVNHVRWRKNGTYIWVCPNKADCYNNGAGRCDSERDRTTDPFKNRNNGWKKAKVRSGLKHVDPKRVMAVAISVSPNFLDWNELISSWSRERRDSYFLELKSILKPLPPRWFDCVDSENSRTFCLN